MDREVSIQKQMSNEISRESEGTTDPWQWPKPANTIFHQYSYKAMLVFGSQIQNSYFAMKNTEVSSLEISELWQINANK